MSFPTSPTNGQITLIGNYQYQYNSANNAWTRITGNNSISLIGDSGTGIISSVGGTFNVVGTPGQISTSVSGNQITLSSPVLGSTANTASANTIYTQGVDVSQNARMTIIEGTDVTQNTRMAIIEGVDVGQNTRMTVSDGVNTSQNVRLDFSNTRMNISDGVNVTQNTRLTVSEGVDLSQNVRLDFSNTRIAVSEGVDVGQNNRMAIIEGVDVSQNARMTISDGVNASQNVSINTQNSFITIIQGVDLGQNTAIAATNQKMESAYAHANNANVTAKAAFDNSNTKFSSSGGSITGPVSIINNSDLTVTGNLFVFGNTTTFNIDQFEIQDPLLLLGVGNYSSDTFDIGFASHYNDGTNAHTGLIRDAGTKEYHFFKGYTGELNANNNIDLNDPSYQEANVLAAHFKGNVIAQKATVNGLDVFSFSTAAFNAANTAQVKTDAAFAQANITIGVDATQNTRLTVIEGTDVSQNARMTIIEGTDVSQNVRIAVSEGVDLSQNVRLDFSNTRMNIIDGVDVGQNNRMTIIEGVDVSQNARMTVSDGVNESQNVSISTQNSFITIIQGVDVGQNSRMAIIEGVDTSQNARITVSEGVNLSQNVRLDFSNTVITIIQGVDAGQNTAINSKVSKSGDTMTGSLQFFGPDFAIGQYDGVGIDLWANNNTSHAQLNFANTNFAYVDGFEAALQTPNSQVLAYTSGNVEIFTSTDGSATRDTWTFDTSGTLTVPGPISGLGNSKLDFNTYGANSAYLTTTSDDSTALFMGTATAELYAYTNIQIRANTGGTSKAWTFGEDGTLTFPDSTIQTTAYVPGDEIDEVARAKANAAYNQANVTIGVDASQNVRLDYSNTALNTAITITQGIDNSQNVRLDYSNVALNTAITITQGVNDSQNVRLDYSNTALNTAITIIQGVDTSQNARMAIIEGTNASQNVRLDYSNSAITIIQGVDVGQNSRMTIIEGVATLQNTFIFATDDKMQSAYFHANGAFIKANAAFDAANLQIGIDNTQNTRMTVIEGVDVSQNARMTIIEGVDVTQNTNIANKLSLSGASLQTVSGNVVFGNDVTVTGNLVILGNTISLNVSSLEVEDTLIQLGIGNYTTDIFSIGYVGHYNDGTNAHAGFIRDSGTKEFYAFQGYTPETTGNTININDASFAKANIHGNWFKGNLIATTARVGGLDVNNFATASFNQANTGTVLAQASFNLANTTVGVDATQNTRLTVIEGTDLSQNVSINTQNSFITIIQGVDTSQNARMTIIEGTDVSQNARIAVSEGVDASQNVRLDYSNTAITIIQGVDVGQNSRMTIIEGVDTSQNARITIIEGVDVTQNTAISSTDGKMQSAYNQANTGTVLAQGAFNRANSTPNNYFANTFVVANLTGYLSNSNVFFVAANNTTVINGNLNVINTLVTNNITSTGSGVANISSATNLDLFSPTSVRIVGGGTLKLPNLSDAQKSTIVATNGDIIYNTTKNKVETYENGNWINSDRAVTNIANVWLANSIIFANTIGYLSNSSSLQYISSNNTIITGNIITTGISGDISNANNIFANTFIANGVNLYNFANAAFTVANTSSANTIIIQGVDNSQNARMTIADGVNVSQNLRIDYSNAAIMFIQGVDVTQNTRLTVSEGVDLSQNVRLDYSNTAITIIQGVDVTQNTRLTVSEGVDLSQNVRLDFSNTRMNIIDGVDVSQNARMTIIEGVNVTQNTDISNRLALSGVVNQTVSGNVVFSNDVTVTGNLIILGNTISLNVSSLEVEDTLIQLGIGNYYTDALSIGYVGHYNDGTNAHAGFIRDSGTKEFYAFQGYTPDTTSNTININDASFTKANIQGNWFKGNLIATTARVGGLDVNSRLDFSNTRMAIIEGVDVTQNTNIAATDNKMQGAYNVANTADIKAQAAFDKANTGVTSSVDQYARDTANAGYFHANGAFIRANAAFDGANVVAGGLVTANANIVVIQGVDTSQNSRMTIIEGVDATQNTRLTVIEGTDASQNVRLDYSNTAITIIQGVDVGQNSRMTIIEGVDSSQNVRLDFSNTAITIIQGVDVGQNTRLTVIEGTDASQNVRLDYSNTALTIIQGVDVTQNTRLTVSEGVDLSQNVSIATQNSFITIIQGVDVGQNTAIAATDNKMQSAYNVANTADVKAQAAFDKANTGGASGLDQYARDTANNASSNTIIIQGVDVTQNTRLTVVEVKAQAAFDQANTGGGGGGGTPLTATVDTFTGNGSNTAFTLSVTPISVNYTIAVVGGVTQPRSEYSIVGTTLTFTSAPANNQIVEVTTLSGGGGSSGASLSGYLANTVIVANSAGYLSNSNSYFTASNNAMFVTGQLYSNNQDVIVTSLMYSVAFG